MAAPTWAGTGTYLAGDFGTTAVVPAPPGIAVDDILVVDLYDEDVSGQTAPSGWTQLAEVTDATDGFSLGFWWKRAVAEDVGATSWTFSWTSAGNTWREASAGRITGAVTTGSPWDVTAATASSGATATTTSPAVAQTTVTADTLLVFSAASFAGGAWTPPSGMTERADNGSDLTVATVAQAVAGASGSKSATCTGSGRMLAILGAVRPAAGGTSGSATGVPTGARSAATPGAAGASSTTVGTPTSARATAGAGVPAAAAAAAGTAAPARAAATPGVATVGTSDAATGSPAPARAGATPGTVPATTASVFYPAGLPTSRTGNTDTAAYTLGTSFRADQAGRVSGVVFFAEADRTQGLDPVTVSLWETVTFTTGTMLASATITAGAITAGAWNVVSFAVPVDVAASPREYVAAITTDRYTYTAGLFGSVTTGHLTANAGRFVAGGTPTFPVSGSGSTWYGVDVLWASAVAGDASTTGGPAGTLAAATPGTATAAAGTGGPPASALGAAVAGVASVSATGAAVGGPAPARAGAVAGVTATTQGAAAVGTPAASSGQALAGTAVGETVLDAPAAAARTTAVPGVVSGTAATSGSPAAALATAVGGTTSVGQAGSAVGTAAAARAVAAGGAATADSLTTGTPAAARAAAVPGVPATGQAGTAVGTLAAARAAATPGTPAADSTATGTAAPARAAATPGVAAAVGQAAATTGSPATTLAGAVGGIASGTAAAAGQSTPALAAAIGGTAAAGAAAFGVPAISRMPAIGGVAQAVVAVDGAAVGVPAVWRTLLPGGTAYGTAIVQGTPAPARTYARPAPPDDGGTPVQPTDFLEELASWLAARSYLGLTWRGDGSPYTAGEVGLFVGVMPPTPDRVVVLTTYAGPDSDSLNGWDEPSVQVRVRGTADPRVSARLAQALYGELHGLGTLTLPAGTWLQLALALQGGPVPIGQDDNRRHEHVINLRTEIRRPTLHRV